MLADWLEEGAPIGVTRQVAYRGVFPLAGERGGETAEQPIPAVEGGEIGLVNYASVEEHVDAALQEVGREVDQGYVERFAPRREAEDAAGGKLCVSRLALIPKREPGKFRLILDCRRSGANAGAKVAESIQLPTVRGAVDLTLGALRASGSGGAASFLVLDFKDAFKQVPLAQAERRFYPFALQGEWFVYRVLPMGAVGSPLVWCRVAAFLARAAAAILGDKGGDIATYVDDPLVVVTGSHAERSATIERVLLLWSVLGAPLAWGKGQSGQRVRWIGAELSMEPGSVVVALPSETAHIWAEELSQVRRSGKAQVRLLRQIAGRGAWLAGVIPEVRPFLNCVWAAVGGRQSGVVSVRSADHAFRWLVALYSHASKGGLVQRSYGHLAAQEAPPLVVVTDASPWGLGGVAFYQNRPVGYVLDGIAPQDAARFGTAPGRCGDQALWEALAILAAICAFGPATFGPTPGGLPRRELVVYTDSMAASGALGKLRSKDGHVNVVARQLAWVLAAWQMRVYFRHVPGAQNELADALSRGVVPPCLRVVRRVPLVPRGHSFWSTDGDPPARRQNRKRARDQEP